MSIRNPSAVSDEELEERYQELAIKAADCVVKHDCIPEEQDWYRELEDLFMELGHREGEQ